MNGGQRRCETGDSDVPDGDSVDEQPGSQRRTTATTDADECARRVQAISDVAQHSVVGGEHVALVVALAAYTFINVTSAGHPCIPAGIHRPSVVSSRRINSVDHSAI